MALAQSDARGSDAAKGWRSELVAIGQLAWPVVIAGASQQAMIVVDQVFLGHLGTAELGAAALATAYNNLMWFFLLGFATALDTLGSHAYGAGDHRALTTWCMTAGLMVTILVFPVALGLSMGEHVASLLFGQDAQTSALMGQFCRGLIPGMWPLMWGIVLTKYLQVQNVMLSPSLVAVATFLLNIAFNAVLVNSIGFRGAPLATTLSRTVQFLMLAAAVWWHERRQARALRDKEESQGLLEASADVQEEPGGWVVVPLETSHKGSAHGASADSASVRAAATAAVGEGQAKAVGQATGMQTTGDEREPYGGDSGSVGDPGAKGRGMGHATEQAAAAAATSQGSHVEQASSHAAAAHSQPCKASGAQHKSEQARLLRPGTDSSSSAPAPPDDSTSLALAVLSEPAEPEPPSPGSLWQRVQDECKAAVQPAVVTRFLRLGIPGGLSLAFEAGSFDVTTVMAGRLGATATAAHAAMLSIITLTYLACPFALATAGAIRVGNLLGAGQPEAAKRAGAVVVALSGGFMLLMAIGILASRNVLGYAFSSDPQVVKVMADIAIFGALFQVSDGLMGSSQGVLRGCGHQTQTAIYNFVGFWGCGVLLGYLLCFHASLGLRGLWIGISSGDTSTAVLNLVAMSRIRWQREADNAVARLKALSGQSEEEADNRESAPVGGGGRSYAGGLKRMWSVRFEDAARAAANKRRGFMRTLSALLGRDRSSARLEVVELQQS